MGALSRASLFLFAAWLLAGCEALMRAEPEPAANVAFDLAPAEPAAWERAALHAASLAGTRYRFGGTSPADGFDCSGLVHFSYREAAGVVLPRDTRSLRTATQRIDRAQLRPGDLIFFRLRGAHGHVGIYAGDGRFVHAPSAGKRVRLENLDAPYWQARYAESRRPQLD